MIRSPLHPYAIIIGLIVLTLWSFGCVKRSAPEPEPDTPYRIVATTGMIADIAREVAGDLAVVENLIGSGLDPHLYQPTRSDVQQLEGANFVIYHGLLLEGRMAEILKRQQSRGRRVLALAEKLVSSGLYPVATGPDGEDPHLWMDVMAWAEATRLLAEELAAHDPAHAATYHENAGRFLTRLESLDRYATESLQTIPENARVLITAHDAFHYFGRRYGLEVLGIQGISTSSEAGIRHIEELVALIVKRGIPAIFVETSVSDKNVRALIEGAQARGHPVVIGGALFSDAMGPEGNYTGTYIGMIDHNVTTITRALGGSAPPGGMQGLLND